MSANTAKFKASPETIFTDADGKVYLYFTDAVVDDREEGLFNWAKEVASDDTYTNEVNLALTLDLPRLTQSLVEFYQHTDSPDTAPEVSIESKPRLECLRQQLIAALAALDKVTYV